MITVNSVILIRSVSAGKLEMTDTKIRIRQKRFPR